MEEGVAGVGGGWEGDGLGVAGECYHSVGGVGEDGCDQGKANARGCASDCVFVNLWS